MSKPTVVILAAGSNSRFFPLNTETHKGFLPLLGKPLVVRALENLSQHGFTHVTLVVNKKDFGGAGLSAKLPKYNLPLKVSWVLQAEATGQGDALLAASDHITSEHFICMSPYYPTAGELAEKLWKTQAEDQSECVFMGTQVDNPSLYGMFEFATDNPKRIMGIIEKPTQKAPSNYKINTVYLLSKKFVSHLAQHQSEQYSLESAITSYAKKHHITWVENTQNLPSLKFAWNLFEMTKYLFTSATTTISPEATIAQTAIIDERSGPIIIEAKAKVGDYAKIIGPCFVGKESMVGDYCLIRGGCTIEAGATVGAYTEVARSIILEKANVHFSYIADSILGQNVHVGAGLITANKRFDRKNIKTMLKGQVVEMPSNAHGVIVGAHTHLGIGTRTMPGVLLGAHTRIRPGSIIDKNTSHGT